MFYVSLVNSIRIKFTMFLINDFYFKRRLLNNGDKIILFMKNFFLKRAFVGKNHTLPSVIQQHPVCFSEVLYHGGWSSGNLLGGKKEVYKNLIII